MTSMIYCRLHRTFEPTCSLCHDYEPAYKPSNMNWDSTARCKHLTTRIYRNYPKIPASKVVEKPPVEFRTFTRSIRELGGSKGCTFPKLLCDMLDLRIRDTVQVAVRKLSSDDLANTKEGH